MGMGDGGNNGGQQGQLRELSHHGEMKLVQVLDTTFYIHQRYKLLRVIGYGAYGLVCSALDQTTNRHVAIKKIRDCFRHVTDAKRTLREIKLLRHFEHENVIGIWDIMRPPSYDQFEDVYIVQELMATDLYNIIISPQDLSDEHCQYFLYQILRGLKYLHSGRVVHRDLKPGNLLVNGNCDLKICDFGLARGMEDEADGLITEYVATRWYRAPEIMLSWSEYDKAIDVWAAGTILAELLNREPLFPGKNYADQLDKIFTVLGTPSPEDTATITSDRSLPQRPAMPWRHAFPRATPVALDLLSRMLVFNPAKRISVDEALAHPYLASFHDPEDEPTQAVSFSSEFEDRINGIDSIKQMIYAEMLSFHPELQQ